MLIKLNSFFNRLFWKTTYEHKSLEKVYHSIAKPFENAIVSFEDKNINKSFENDNVKWYHNEYLYFLHNWTVVEPSNYICIKNLRTLIYESFPSTILRPSLLKYLLYKFSFKKPKRINEAILFDGTLGTNYFHFFSDILHKLWLLERFNFDKNIPLIISQKTFNTKYFQHLYNHTDLKEMRWVIQDQNTWIKVKKLYLVKPMPYHLPYWKKTIELLHFEKISEPTEKYFLTRTPQRGRHINNMGEIEDVLNSYGIKLIDTDQMELPEQAALFARASLVISLHGAGNTNIIFGNPSKMKFIEIVPADRIACHYYWLSEVLKIDYDVIAGGALEADKSFYLDPELLRKAIEKNIKK